MMQDDQIEAANMQRYSSNHGDGCIHTIQNRQIGEAKPQENLHMFAVM
jgi:hypothetical protein